MEGRHGRRGHRIHSMTPGKLFFFPLLAIAAVVALIAFMQDDDVPPGDIDGIDTPAIEPQPDPSFSMVGWSMQRIIWLRGP